MRLASCLLSAAPFLVAIRFVVGKVSSRLRRTDPLSVSITAACGISLSSAVHQPVPLMSNTFEACSCLRPICPQCRKESVPPIGRSWNCFSLGFHFPQPLSLQIRVTLGWELPGIRVDRLCSKFKIMGTKARAFRVPFAPALLSSPASLVAPEIRHDRTFSCISAYNCAFFIVP